MGKKTICYLHTLNIYLEIIYIVFDNYNHCVKRVRIRSYSGPHFFRIFPNSECIRRVTLYLSVFSLNAGKSGKNADQNNSEYELFFRRDCNFVLHIVYNRPNREKTPGENRYVMLFVKKGKKKVFVQTKQLPPGDRSLRMKILGAIYISYG